MNFETNNTSIYSQLYICNYKGFNEMDITLLECPTWGERLKRGDKRVLLDVVKAVKTEKSDQKGRVLVLSR